MTTKRLYRDLQTGELRDTEDLYRLVPIDDPEEPKEPREAYMHAVAPPPSGARELRNQQDNTLRYMFDDYPHPAPEPPAINTRGLIGGIVTFIATGAFVVWLIHAVLLAQWRI